MGLGILDLISLQQGGFAGIHILEYSPIDFPLDLPAAPGFRNFKVTQRRSQKISESPISLKAQVEETTGSKWLFEVGLPAMKREAAGPWRGLFNMLDGRKGTVMIGDPLSRQPLGNPAGLPVVRDSNQSGSVLIVGGCSPNIVGWLKAGDQFQIGERMHEISRDCNSNDEGVVILDFWPALRQVYDVGTPIVTSNPKVICRQVSTTTDHFESDEGRFYQISATFEEAL
jgi:hypothetical protein